MGEMPYALYPMQIIGADLIGPFVETDSGHKFVLTIIDHFSGWAEAYPLKSKRYLEVFDILRKQFFPSHGYPEIMICDNGGEFTAKELKDYLRGVGVEQRVTTPYHPASNGKIERFNKTLKEMLSRMVNGQRGDWEERLGEALMAYRNSVSTVTGHTPFFLMYGRRGRLPLTKMLTAEEEGHVRPIGSRLHDLSNAFKLAREMTVASRKYNRDRLQAEATAGNIEVGDSVIVAANEPLTLTAKWDPEFEVTRVVGTTCWIRHQTTGKELKVHREKLRLVDPDAAWEDVRERPRRQRLRANLVIPEIRLDPIPEIGLDPRAAPNVCEENNVGEQNNIVSHQNQTGRQRVHQDKEPSTQNISEDVMVQQAGTSSATDMDTTQFTSNQMPEDMVQKDAPTDEQPMFEDSSTQPQPEIYSDGVAGGTRSKRRLPDLTFPGGKRGRR